jgi:cysteine-rich repeat protein
MKIITPILLALLFLFLTPVYSQAPEAFNYQAVLRSSGGQVMSSQSIDLKVQILDAVIGGAILYSESHSLTTSPLGLINIAIGQGANSSTAFDSLSWGSSAQFIEILIDSSGQGNYISMGTTQLLSVPYALYAKTSGNAGTQGPTGPQGTAGTNGTNGTDGATGPTGNYGAAGAQGPTGPSGPDELPSIPSNPTNGTHLILCDSILVWSHDGYCPSICGNGIVEGNEACDDGNMIYGDGCNNCQSPFVGNNILDPGEECDDGNIISGDGCSSTGLAEYCGDGLKNNSNEECDDGNLIDGDGCNNCQSPFVGNNILDPGEECDDGNTISGDGCSSTGSMEYDYDATNEIELPSGGQEGEVLSIVSGEPAWVAYDNVYFQATSGWISQTISGTNYQEDVTVLSTEVLDSSNSYNPTTCTFTAPINGAYSFSAHLTLNSTSTPSSGGVIFGFVVNNAASPDPTQTPIVVGQPGEYTTDENISFSAIIYLNAGDNVKVGIYGASDGENFDISYAGFSGFKIN